MNLAGTIQANLEGVQPENYQSVELPPGELGKANLVRQFKKRVILFQDEHGGDFYKKGLLKDSDNEVYWVEWLGKDKEKITRRYHIHDLKGLMIRVYP